MKIWILVLFSFNLNYAYSTQYEFYTEKACQEALTVIENSKNTMNASAPAAMTLKVQCIEDTKPNK